MKVLVACEFSGIVRDAFLAKGHDAISCDLLPTEKPGPHYQGDVLDLLDVGFVNDYKFDLMIAHPPCTHLAVSGARYFKDKLHQQADALTFVRMLMDANIPRICIENPVGVISTKIRKPDQIIQPYEFGHMEQKKTCLWLNNLPKLQPTNNVYAEMMLLPKKERERMHYCSPGPDRWKIRSRTYENIGKAMAEQWGSLDGKDERA